MRPKRAPSRVPRSWRGAWRAYAIRAADREARSLTRARWLIVWTAVAAFAAGALLLAPRTLQAADARVALAAGAIYLAAHGLRAVRLAVLAGPLLGITARTAGLLHLVTAPLALLAPLKLGELFRLQQLAVTSGQLANSVLVLLLDRMFDALFLVPIMVALAVAHAPGEIEPATLWLTATAAVLPLVAVVLGPGLLAALQDYVVIHHLDPRALRLLPVLDALRRVTEAGALTARRQGLQLALLSVLIWGAELAATWLLARFVAGSTRDAGLLLTDRLVDLWGFLGGSGQDPALAASAAISLLALLLIWPIALLHYFRRVDFEPRRRRASAKAPGGASWEAGHGR